MAGSSWGRSSSPSRNRKPSSPFSSTSSSSSLMNGRLLPRSCSSFVTSIYDGAGEGYGSRSMTPSLSMGDNHLSRTPVSYPSVEDQLVVERVDYTSKAGDSISVTIRFRPMSEREYQRGEEIAWYADSEKLVRNEYNPMTAYAFDRVFGPNTITEEVYEVAARPVVKAAMEGINDHKRDAARAENSLTLTFGSELIGMQRDWNEELQSCREIPHATHQERILRDKALYRVTSDFVDAAASGAIGVVNRCIPPINPADPECFHMYVHNNIFFSFAVDAELEQFLRKQASGLNSKVQTAASADKLDDNLPQGVSRVSYVDENAAPNMENINNAEALSSDLPAEAQLAENDQPTYASANNDLKGTKAYQEADVPGLYNLAMAIIDYRGHRVVAHVHAMFNRIHVFHLNSGDDV